MKRVYFASKLQHASMWNNLKDPRIHAHARWLKHIEYGTKETSSNARIFWEEDLEDIASSDFVVVYAEEGEHLRGALVEAGMAIALKIPVILIGDHPDYGTWQHHRNVVKFDTLEEAFFYIDTGGRINY
jgi:nucleoside 2-deoxyribosyltransferase